MDKPVKKRPLTNKQKAFVKHIVENPKASYTEAAVVAYDVKNRNVAASIAAENLTKPAIISELDNFNEIIEETMANAVKDWGRSEKVAERTLAVDTAKFMHDKIHGKARQTVESRSTKVNISINMTTNEEFD
jgi:hypothetical protein